MAIPEQIRKQSEAVKDLYEELNREATGEENVDDATQDESVTAELDSSSEDGTSGESVSNEPKGKKPEDAMEQKYRTLQGMYNAEVPRLHSQNKELQGRLQQMEQLLSTLSKQQQSQQQQISERLITEKDVEDYGEDAVDMMRRVSREEYMPVMNKIVQLEGLMQQLQTQLVPQVQQVVQKQALSTDQQFWAGLQQAVPDWKQINSDPNFHTWLLQADPLTGIQRQSMLQQAQSSYDLSRVINFFRTWMKEAGISEHGQTETAGAAKNTRKTQLEQQVAPGRSRGGSGSPTASDKRSYTPQDIEKFFTEVRKGKYKGRDEERSRIERDIFAAQNEGRIVANS
jgi:hypothetical protein